MKLWNIGLFFVLLLPVNQVYGADCLHGEAIQCFTDDGQAGVRICYAGHYTDECIITTVTGRLRISQYDGGAGATVTNSQADDILANASNVLQTKDGPEDFICNFVLERLGDVETFSTGDGSIDNIGEFNAVISSGLGRVKIVPQINSCGGIMGTYLGCANIPGNKMIVVSGISTPLLAGIVWAHEFGHNQNRNHPTASMGAGLPQRVMNWIVTEASREITLDECTAYRELPILP